MSHSAKQESAIAIGDVKKQIAFIIAITVTKYFVRLIETVEFIMVVVVDFMRDCA